MELFTISARETPSTARSRAHPSRPDPASPTTSGALGRGGDAAPALPNTPARPRGSLHAGPQGISTVSLNTCVHPACYPSRITSEAWVVVSGPNLSDFDWAPAQSRQDQTLAQEVAAHVAERVRLSRHVRALPKTRAAGVKELLTRAGVATQAAAATAAVASRVPSRSFAAPARPRGLEQEDGETRHRVRGERGGAGDRLPPLPLPATPPG